MDFTTNGVGDTTIGIDTGSGTVLAGDVVTFAGDTNKYIVATGAGRNMTITVLPQMIMDVDLSKYEKYDLDSDLLLTPDEITSLLDGTLYRDILAARRAAAETPSLPEVNKDIPF